MCVHAAGGLGLADSHIHVQTPKGPRLECGVLFLASPMPKIHTEGALIRARRGKNFVFKYRKYFVFSS